MSINVPPKNTAVYAGAGHNLTDPFISNFESSDPTFESCGLKSVVLYLWKLVCAKNIPTAEKKILTVEGTNSYTCRAFSGDLKMSLEFI